jgi:argininosuccinate synthase
VPKYAELIYNGYWFSPEFDFFGSIRTKPGTNNRTAKSCFITENDRVLGFQPYSLYNEALGSMEVSGGYQPSIARDSSTSMPYGSSPSLLAQGKGDG